MARVQVCAVNEVNRSAELRRRLEQAGYLVDTEQCLDQCVRCRSWLFCLTDGRYVFARTGAEFLLKTGCQK
ncbi:MAG: DUF1450 domain-containing protein [Mycobacterium leprae]